MTAYIFPSIYTILMIAGFYMAIRVHGRRIKEDPGFGNYYQRQKGIRK
jgi:hypothetical protein